MSCSPNSSLTTTATAAATASNLPSTERVSLETSRRIALRGLEPYKSHDSCDSEACPLHDGLRGSTETGPGLQHHSYSCTAPQLSNFPAQLKLSGSRARYRYRYSSSYSPTATAPRSSLALQLAKDTATAPDQQPFTRLICCEAPPEVCLARAGYPQAPKHIFINCSLLLQKKIP